jgi:glycerophosphoryl diester phosphodiesterase
MQLHRLSPLVGVLIAAVVAAGPASALKAVAHRGEHQLHDSDTVSSVLAAFQLGTGAEVDVFHTSDRVAVVTHNRDLSPRTTCVGLVDQLTAAEVATCRTKHREQPIPTLEDVVDTVAANPGHALHLDLKGPWTSPEIVSLRDMLTAQHVRARTSVMTSGYALLTRIHKVAPAIRTAWRSIDGASISVSRARAFGVAIVMIRRITLLTKARVTAFHKAGLQVWLRTTSNAAAWDTAATYGVDKVMTDDPALFAQHFPSG